MKYINKNETPLKVYREIPTVWNSKHCYELADTGVWYADGFREFVMPEYNTATHKLGRILYDTDQDIGTRDLEALSQEELEANAAKEQQRLIQEQVDLQILREERGKEEFRLMTAALRAQVGSGLALDDYNAIEVLLEPLGDTICFGKWTKCYMMLVELGAENVGADLYNQLEAKLRAGIIELYDQHDYPFEV